ncbi:YlqD family protein [Bacillus sp. BRMEA1]|uniref:YlqD family protein n=1 Tax=Neobacillus endophyticus TaxID=2738405 RepID=UPI001567402E|nr:YlqD family protein [Neobacillus endophyticus]NRD78852.1 YlqD family protein [Neobacillus endophyticus]
MQILQTVVVKQILTEKSKKKLFDTYYSRKLQLQKECDQLHFELKRLENTKNFSQASLKTQFEKEISSRRDKVKILDFQMEQLQILPIGSELKEDEVQALVDIKIGDTWNDVKTQPVIIVKDGIIEEIRR